MRKHALLLGVIASLVISILAYFGVNSLMDSLFAFRSPLHDSPPGPGVASGMPLTQRVVLVLVDGLRLDTSLKPGVMPYLSELRTRGASATMHSRPPTFSAPSFSVLSTGAWPELSDGPAMNLEYEEYTAWTQDNIFSAAHRAGLTTGVSGFYWFEKLIPQGTVTDSYYTPGEDREADREVVDAALPWLQGRRHALTLVHLDQVDYAGHHEGGAASDNWDLAAGRADSLLREIAATLDLSRDTLLVVADHGQIDAGGHGGQDAITRLEPFVLAGAGVRPGEYGDINQVDVAPTIAALLGAALPASAQGGAVTEMLNLTPDDLARLKRAEAAQQARLAGAYADAIGRPVSLPAGASVKETQAAMAAARDARLQSERWPRMVVALVLLVVLALVLWRTRSRTTALMLLSTAVYLVAFNMRYVALGGTYSLSSVTGEMDLILAMALNTGLALLAGWLVLTLTTGLLGRGAGGAARLTLAWVLLTLAVAALPLLAHFAWNGLLVGWTLPQFDLLFTGFLALLQILFGGVLGLLLASMAALLARLTVWSQRRAAGVPAV